MLQLFVRKYNRVHNHSQKSSVCGLMSFGSLLAAEMEMKQFKSDHRNSLQCSCNAQCVCREMIFLCNMPDQRKHQNNAFFERIIRIVFYCLHFFALFCTFLSVNRFAGCRPVTNAPRYYLKLMFESVSARTEFSPICWHFESIRRSSEVICVSKTSNYWNHLICTFFATIIMLGNNDNHCWWEWKKPNKKPSWVKKHFSFEIKSSEINKGSTHILRGLHAVYCFPFLNAIEI